MPRKLTVINNWIRVVGSVRRVGSGKFWVLIKGIADIPALFFVLVVKTKNITKSEISPWFLDRFCSFFHWKVEKNQLVHMVLFLWSFPRQIFWESQKTRFSIAIYWLCRWRFTWISLLFDSPQVFYDGKVCSILFKTCFPDVPRTGNTISDQIVKSY